MDNELSVWDRRRAAWWSAAVEAAAKWNSNRAVKQTDLMRLEIETGIYMRAYVDGRYAEWLEQ